MKFATGKMPVPQEFNFFVEQAVSSATGKMPVPQEFNFVVEQASCLFMKMIQNVN